MKKEKIEVRTLKKKEDRNLCFVPYCRNKYFAVWKWIDGGYSLLCKKHSIEEFRIWSKGKGWRENMLLEGVLEEKEIEELEELVEK